MKRIDDIVYTTVDELVSIGISENTIKSAVLRGSSKWQSIADPEDRRRRLIRYDTMGEKYKMAIRNVLWGGLEAEEWEAVEVARQRGNEATRTDELGGILKKACEEGYRQYLGLYRNIKTECNRVKIEQERCLARSAAVVDAVGKWYLDNGIDWRKYDGYKTASKWLKSVEKWYFPRMYVRSNPVGLAEQVRKVFVDKVDIRNVVYMPRVGNENRKGENHSFGMAMMVRLLTDGSARSVSNIYRKVRQLCALNGYPEPSESTLRSWEVEVRNLVATRRYGNSSKASTRMQLTIPMAKPMYAGDLWEMDGTRVQLQPHETKDGTLKALYVVAVRDVYSGTWLGWYFCRAESFVAYQEALKMAVTVSGYLPCEIRHDRFPGQTKEEWDRFSDLLISRGVKLTEVRTATGKASTERAFETLQTVFEMNSKAWIGQGIKSSRDYARPTKEYLAAAYKNLREDEWGWVDAVKEEMNIFLQYNHTRLSEYSKKYKQIQQSPWELHEAETERVNTKPVQSWEIAELFWSTKEIQIRNGLVKITVSGRDYEYSLIDPRYADLLINRSSVVVRYEPKDMSSVMLFDKVSGELIDEVKQFSRIQLAGSEPEYGELSKLKAKRKALQDVMSNRMKELKAGSDVDPFFALTSGIMDKELTERAQDSEMYSYIKMHKPIEPDTIIKEKVKKQKQAPQAFVGDAKQYVMEQYING